MARLYIYTTVYGPTFSMMVWLFYIRFLFPIFVFCVLPKQCTFRRMIFSFIRFNESAQIPCFRLYFRVLSSALYLYWLLFDSPLNPTVYTLLLVSIPTHSPLLMAPLFVETISFWFFNHLFLAIWLYTIFYHPPSLLRSNCQTQRLLSSIRTTPIKIATLFVTIYPYQVAWHNMLKMDVKKAD